MAITAVAPIAWGSTYYVTRHYLPTGTPLTGAAIRALPAGLLLVALRPALPRGSWWWRTAVISTLTIGGFFVLVYIAGSRLPSSVAATVMAGSALATVLLSWVVLSERPQRRRLMGSLAGLVGVMVMVGAAGHLDGWGLTASFTAMVSSSLGFVLTKRWNPPVSPLTFAGWQLTAGGILLTPVALAVEGVPPVPDATQLTAYGYLVVVATALAYWAWFTGLRRLDPTRVGLIGLLNPLAGAALGLALGGESLTLGEAVGAVLVVSGVVAGIAMPRTIYSTLGDVDAETLVADLLGRSGLTKSELSRRSGVSRSLLDGYLKGTRQPSLAQLNRLGEAAGHTVDVVWHVAPAAVSEEYVAVMELAGQLAGVRDELPPLRYPHELWRSRTVEV